jgi:acyl-CoA dehydrogenase
MGRNLAAPAAARAGGDGGPLVNFELPDELKMLQQLVRTFTDREFMPLEKDVKDDPMVRLPPQVKAEKVAKMKELGLWAMSAPAELGGGGLGALPMAVAIEQYYRCIAGRNLWSVVVSPQLLRNPEHRAKYAEPTVRGEKRGCSAFTEPNAGGDLAGIETTCERDGDNWIINGSKVFISFADEADYCMVLTRLKGTSRRDGMTWFVVDKGTPGFNVVRQIGMMAGNDTFELSFDNCVVPASQLVGEPGKGWDSGQGQLAEGRVGIGARGVAIADRCLDMAVPYAKSRRTFGEPIASRQAVQWMLADSLTELHATRLMLYHAAWKSDQGQDTRQEIAMLKVFAAEMAGRVVDRTLQIHGSIGLSKDLPIEKFYRDVRAMRIYEGPSEVQRMVIARNMLR